MKNYKQYVVIGVMGFILSCTSNKKIQQDDEFATDSSVETTTTEASATPTETSEFDLNETPASTPPSESTAAAGKDEFADFEDPTAQVAPTPTVDAGSPPPSEAQPKDEFADFEQPAAPTETPPVPEKLAENKLESELNSVPAPPDATPLPVEIPAPIAQELPPVPVPEVAAEPPKPAEPVEEPAQITAINYQSNQSGGAVSITASRPIKFTTRLNSATNQLVIELPNATIPSRLKRSLNTKDMASSIGSVDIYQKANSNVARFVVQLRPGSVEPLVQPEGNSLLVIGAANEAYVAKQKEEAEVKAKAQAPAESEGFTDLAADGVMSSQSMEQFLVGNQKYYGKKISIETNNLEIKEAIKFVAEESGTNLLMDEGLEGKISLKLRQVPWDQALILILKAKKLGYVRQGNVLRIAKLSDLQTEEVEAYKLLESRRSNEPLVVKRFFISYAKLSDLEQKIREFIVATATTNTANTIGGASASPAGALPGASAPGAATSTNLAGGVFRGRVIADERTGSLIVTDTPDNLIKIEKLIAALDTQPKQVVVESRIISATESFTRSLGVFWSSTGSSSTPNSAKLGINNLTTGVFDSTFTWGNLDIVGNLDARIALGEIQNKVRVLNTQRTTVISGQSAKIEAKGKLNIPTIVVNTTTNTNVGTSDFKTIDFGLVGDVTPQVSNENTITASISLSNTKVVDPKNGSTTTDAIGGRVVSRNGQTIVVQANFQSTNTTSETGVPGLKDIPVLGLLFKGKTDSVTKAETMLFSTMYILDPVGGAVKKAAVDNSELEIK